MERGDLLRALEMFAKNWLAHDGCWFLAAEERLGMDTAIDLDTRSWERFAAVEAQRIMSTFHIAPLYGGLEALEKALGLRMYSLINAQRVEWSPDRKRMRFSHGRMPRARGATPQRSGGFSLQERRDRRVRNFRPHRRSANSDHMPALSSRRNCRAVLRMGIYSHGNLTFATQARPYTPGELDL